MPMANVDVTEHGELLIELQTQVAFQEDLLSALNDRVTEQDRELRTLREQMKALGAVTAQLRVMLEEQGAGGESVASAIERPPHY
ncbi:MAG: SlyX family protein [Spongiibacter sp.]|uniref:SlyX family protein n=1 Tax=Spongiibacter thalassae TaxID=2721624 RepID=A0ABX1GH03_9GAMM|nr:SlyX family protein [Spongiibacter thalassae]MDX1505973.1 SlyX family protein [Spongiibacter sp.]NKI17813.1 SlyX family protein [Spongiibacter thalassae]